jgi:hypothetical protein
MIKPEVSGRNDGQLAHFFDGNKRLRCCFLGILPIIGCLLLLPVAQSQPATNQLVQIRHSSGQGVAPVYEGYDTNPDGSFNMWFGYMNHNYAEELDIPAGPENHFEPGGDRGQPTHFSVRRHKDVFRVTVPADFGDQKLVWSLTSHGQSYQVVGTLNRVWMIDRKFTTRGGNMENSTSNRPPVVTVEAPHQTIAAPGSVTLAVSATDDGLPKRQGKSIGMTIVWAKYRGPGAVVFDPAQAKIVDGKALATARFSQPGDYVLQAVVDDGSGEVAGNFGYHCCWTNTEVTVTVKGDGSYRTAPAVSGGPVTFSKDIAPIFQKSCQTCHRPGTAVPMSLTTYAEVRPWAKAIRTRVLKREMPPWHLDKTTGIHQYKNDISLSDEAIAKVVEWVDNGAPEGNPAEMPPPRTFASNKTWFIGEPDLIATTDKDFTMYARGPDWWIDQYGELKLTEDRWIKAMEVKPSNPKVVHHSVVYVIEPDAPAGTPETGLQLTEYAVGKYGDTFADNTGRLLKAGTRLRFDMHYFATGKEETNGMMIAFKFYPKGFVPKYDVRSVAIRNIPNDELEVPPNSVVRTDGYYRLTRNARIDAFQPHMHMRGRGMTLEAINPDNTTTILSSVDHFDFNWHINYVYEDDVAPLLPAGTVLHMIGIHDNTAANPRNPDPNMWAGFGERSVDDMVQVWLDIVYLDDAEFHRLVDERKTKSEKAPTLSAAR